MLLIILNNSEFTNLFNKTMQSVVLDKEQFGGIGGLGSILDCFTNWFLCNWLGYLFLSSQLKSFNCKI